MGNNKVQRRKIQILSIITLFVFLFDIYVIIYVPTDYILGTAAFVTFVFSILTLSSWFNLKEIENKRREEQYVDIMKAEKGTYVITLDMLRQLDEKINFIGQKIMPLGKAGDETQKKIASMLDSVIEDQKKIAKITISRSKENANALMNSNDQLLVQMEAFRDSIEIIKDQISRQVEISGQENEGFGEIKDELVEKMQELTESIKKEVDEISENIELSSHSMEDLVKSTAEMAKAQAVQAEQPQQPVIPEAVQTIEEPIIPKAVQTIEEPVIPEPVQTTEEPVIPEPVQTIEEPVIPEPVQTIEEPVIPEPVMEITAPVEEEKPPMPDMSDPNKIMSPEDIAALIANTAAEDLSEETPKFEEEEKPPMPDMSDPNKIMSPEDIAALIANM